MKSLWKRLIQSTIVVGISTCSTAALVADSGEQPGIVRISRPSSSATEQTSLTQANQSQFAGDGSSVNAGPINSNGVTPVVCNAPGYGMSCDQGQACDGACNICGRRMGRRWGRGNGPCGYGNGAGMDPWGCDPSYGNGCYGWGGGCGCLSHQAMCDYLRCKFGYFIPTGGGGYGVPWCGHYSRVYPVNPYYFDSRDGQVWAAQGYGVPVSVPLAPVVGHTYELSQGIPSSRLVPVSRPAY